MIHLKLIPWPTAFAGVVFLCAGTVRAVDIGGTISSTRIITEDSQLVDDVTCTVTGAPCIVIASPNVKLELNGFTITGQAAPRTACNGGGTGTEIGINVNSQMGVEIRGPGLIQRFRGAGVFLITSIGITVKDVTVSTNCFSGILVQGGSLHDLTGNVAVRNGNVTNPCGGI